jgi:hypothetical protein
VNTRPADCKSVGVSLGSMCPIVRVAILVGDHLGTTRYARGRTTCAYMNVMRGHRKPTDGS